MNHNMTRLIPAATWAKMLAADLEVGRSRVAPHARATVGSHLRQETTDHTGPTATTSKSGPRSRGDFAFCAGFAVGANDGGAGKPWEG